MSSNLQSISFINDREFPVFINGIPGPVGYQLFMHDKAIGIAPNPVVFLINWLADGLLLYRCYVVYSKNYWVITFPFLMYLASIATGILLTYQVSRPSSVVAEVAAMVHFGIPQYSLSFALNILLALMIITRLTLHRRNIQNAMGTAAGTGGFYGTITTIIVESYAIVLVVAILYIGTWAAKSYFQYILLHVLAQAQVIAPFLVIIRIADRRAVTSDTFVSENIDSIHFGSQGTLTGGSGTLSGRCPIGLTDAGELGVGVETTIDIHRDSVSGSEGTLKS